MQTGTFTFLPVKAPNYFMKFIFFRVYLTGDFMFLILECGFPAIIIFKTARIY